MNAAPADPELSILARDFAGRFAVIIAALVALIARAFLRPPRLAPLIIPLCRRLNRTARRLMIHLARQAAGQLPAPSRPGRTGTRAVQPAIPTTHAWLVRALKHEAAAYACQLSHLLAAPGVSDLLDAVPATRRLLRPVCRMLGVSDTPPTGVARQATGAPSRTESGGAVFYPPPCPHLRLRWPWYTKPNPNPA